MTISGEYPKGGHVIRWEWDHDRVTGVLLCDEPLEADCRLACECDCAEWDVERDQQGPFHVVGGDPDSWVVHRMTQGGPCNAVEWVNNTGVEDTAEWGQRFTVGDTRVVPVWAPGGYEWGAV